MNIQKAEKVIRKLAMRGESQEDILKFLEKKGLGSESHTQMVEKIIREYKAAQAFLPVQPPKKRIRTLGAFLILISSGVLYFFRDYEVISGLGGKGDPRFLGGILLILGILFVLLPEKATEKL